MAVLSQSFVQFNVVLAWNFLFALSGRIPRLILHGKNYDFLSYPVYQNHTVFFHQEDSNDFYVGGTGFILQIDVENNRVIKKFPLNATEQTCLEGPCQNVITVIQKFEDSLFVCGSNGENSPQCWKLPSQVDNQTHGTRESYEGVGISPHVHTQNSLSLTVDGDLYAAAPLGRDGSLLQFRRKAGRRTSVWMYGMWMSEPTFISVSWVQRTNDPNNEKIYIFFREKNPDQSPEADPWISRVARVCKVDEGGSKRFFQNMWTSFLKARLVCAIPRKSLYFNHLQDVYVQHAEDWRQSRVYGLFTSSWNSSAVCIYSMEDIDNVFEKSTFKGFDNEIPNPRPGQCVPDSKILPLATVNVVKEHPEMTDWIHPIHPDAPFYRSSNNYTKIIVDQVQAADGNMHNVLFLATDSGMIHKVLEDGSEPFIISEIRLSIHSTIIRSMELESKKKRLIVGLSEQIFNLDLQRCQDYNGSCPECVLARDPYCAWSRILSRCSPTVRGSIQNIMGGQTSVCFNSTKETVKMVNSTQRDTGETLALYPVSPPTVHSVPLDVPFYLSCPMDSYHAVYTWEHDGQSSPCPFNMQSSCLHLIPAMAQGNYGGYKCMSKERDYSKIVMAYKLVEPEQLKATEGAEAPICKSIPDKRRKAVTVVSEAPEVPVCRSFPDVRSGVKAVTACRNWLVSFGVVAIASFLH